MSGGIRSVARSAAAAVLRRIVFPGRARLMETVDSILGRNYGTFTVPLLGGGVLHVDGVADRSLFYLGSYGWKIHTFLIRAVKTGDVVVDLGANIGAYTVSMARRVGDSGRVFAFEASPLNYEMLVDNIAINKLTNTTPVFGAVVDRSGMLDVPEVKSRGDFIGNYSLAMQCPTQVTIPGWSLDEFAAAHAIDRIDLMKIDIEGCETKAVRGTQRLFRSGKVRMVVCEFNPVWLKRMGTSAVELYDFFVEMGMEAFVIDRFSRLHPLGRDFCVAWPGPEYDVVLKKVTT